MERSRQVKIVISSLVLLFVFSFGFVYLFLNRENVPEKEEEGVLGSTKEESILTGAENTYGAPYIVSVAPLEVVEGEVYEYYPRIEDSDSDPNSLVLELVEAPDWLRLVDMGVVGTVPFNIGDNDTISYTLRVSDGEHSSSQKNYILVNRAGE